MFDIGLPELIVILVIILLVVGPEDIPRILYRVGRIVRHISGYWNSVRNTIGDVMHEAELNEYRIKAKEEKNKAVEELLGDFEVEKALDKDIVLPIRNVVNKKATPKKKTTTKSKTKTATKKPVKRTTKKVKNDK